WLTGLELKARGQLNLPLAEEEPVRAGHLAERGVVIEIGCRTNRGDAVEGVIYRRHLGVVEEVETLSQQFEFRLFSYAETTRNPHIEVPDFRLLEEVPRHERQAERTIGPVDSASLRNPEICAGRTAGSITRVSRT